MTAAEAAAVGSAEILDPSIESDARLLADLGADPEIEHVDSWASQRDSLMRLKPTLDSELVAEAPRFAYYPWRRSVVKILGPESFRRLRLDRNRNLITADEQDRLGRLRIGVIGLSSGHVVAHTLALQGLGGELRLADFDDLDLSNLNRIPAGVFDLDLNKTTVAARRIAELDPYLTVQTWPGGVTAEGIDSFLDGLDVVVEECDSLDVKVLVRRAARRHRLPALMATSDRGLVDVERFDLEPDREIFHGLLGDVDPTTLAGLSSRDKVPYVLRLIEVGGLSARTAASLLEVGHVVSTLPQLAGDVTLGAGAVAEAIRRIGLSEPLSSGRIRLDVGAALDAITAPTLDELGTFPDEVIPDEAVDLVGSIIAAAVRAPSGGNVQPWTIARADDGVTIELAPERTSAIDVEFRGSAVAVGAAVYNARVAAARHGLSGHVEFTESTVGSPLRARIRLIEGVDGVDDLASRYGAMTVRETNRSRGEGTALPPGVVAELRRAAADEGGLLRVLTASEQVDSIADVFSAADRIRYLTSRLHEEMVSELRWPGDEDPDTGIDVRSLELGPRGDLALEVLRRPDVMAELSVWGGGAALGEETAAGIRASSAVAVVCGRGHGLADYARGGSALEATWILAQELGLAVQPISPVFLYATNDAELLEIAPKHVAELSMLQSRFHAVAGIDDDESLILVLRLSIASPATTRSRRRSVEFEVPPLG